MRSMAIRCGPIVPLIEVGICWSVFILEGGESVMNVKDRIKEEGLFQYEVAEHMKLSEFTLSRYLRRPNNLDHKLISRINTAIDAAKKEKMTNLPREPRPVI